MRPNVKHNEGYESAIECDAWYQQAIDLRAEFEREHPHYCRKCDGWGQLGPWFGDPDVGFWGTSLCPECEGAGRCPWCGSSLVADAPERLVHKCSDPACKWHEEENRQGMVSLPEC